MLRHINFFVKKDFYGSLYDERRNVQQDK